MIRVHRWSRLIAACAMRPVRCAGAWYWRNRWPWLPFSLVLAMTFALHFREGRNNPRQRDWLDTVILVEIVFVTALIIFAIVKGTKRDEWTERTTGLVLFTLGTFILYGVFFLAPRLSIAIPFPFTFRDFLRGCLFFGCPLLLYAYSDWLRERFPLFERFRLWRYRRRLRNRRAQ